MSEVIKINEEEFENKYRPIKNPHNKNSGWNGCLFETYGVEYNFVKNQSASHIWTLLSNGTLVSGHHFADRVGYVVTLNPWINETEVPQKYEA